MIARRPGSTHDPFVFEVAVFVSLLLVFGILVAIGLWHSRRASDIWDKDRHARWESQANVEGGDIREMVTAQNELRARRGKAPLSDREIRELATVEQRKQLKRAKRDRRRRSKARRRATGGG